MNYLRIAVCVVVLSLTSHQASAGVWESILSFFGSEETSAQQQETGSTQGALMETGMQLLPMLMQQLGINYTQASGGMGALLQAAQVLMPESDFSKLTKAIPQSAQLVNAAPSVDTANEGLVGNLTKLAGELSPTAQAALDLHAQFKSLGMGAEMIPKFADVANNYLGQNNNAETGNALLDSLSSML